MIVCFPLYFHIFLSCIQIVYTHRSFAALQLLEFFWNSTCIGTCCLDCRHINGYLSHIIWIYGFITYHTDGKHGFTGFTMLIIACCALWTCGFWNSVNYTNVYIEKHPLLICIQAVYTRFFPSISKYGVYNSSLLIVLCTCIQSCAMHLHLIVFVASYRACTLWTHH